MEARRRGARTATSRTAYAQQRESMKIIVDIGHARKTGAEGNRLEEHEVSCVVAGYLVEELGKLGHEVLVLDFPRMSNAADLNETIKEANASGYEAGVSLHCDSASKIIIIFLVPVILIPYLSYVFLVKQPFFRLFFTFFRQADTSSYYFSILPLIIISLLNYTVNHYFVILFHTLFPSFTAVLLAAQFVFKGQLPRKNANKSNKPARRKRGLACCCFISSYSRRGLFRGPYRP